MWLAGFLGDHSGVCNSNARMSANAGNDAASVRACKRTSVWAYCVERIDTTKQP